MNYKPPLGRLERSLNSYLQVLKNPITGNKFLVIRK